MGSLPCRGGAFATDQTEIEATKPDGDQKHRHDQSDSLERGRRILLGARAGPPTITVSVQASSYLADETQRTASSSLLLGDRFNCRILVDAAPHGGERGFEGTKAGRQIVETAYAHVTDPEYPAFQRPLPARHGRRVPLPKLLPECGIVDTRRISDR